jgi:menaquinone-dependent protoporphyrinogen oxidase
VIGTSGKSDGWGDHPGEGNYPESKDGRARKIYAGSLVIRTKEYEMDGKVLVAYASQYGATMEIAERMGVVLRRSGFDVDVLPVDQVDDLTSYQSIIVGSGVYIGQWNKKASQFLSTNEKTLASRKVWIFSSGPTGEGDPEVLLEGWRLPPTVQTVAERIRPLDVAVFHGYINPAKLNVIQRWVIKNIVKKPLGDYRDWKSIEDWTSEVAKKLASQN